MSAHDFNACAKRYRGDYRSRKFTCREQLLCMAFAQLTFRESLRDIETCLNSLGPTLYHAGFRNRVSCSTLADANRLRDWRILFRFGPSLDRPGVPALHQRTVLRDGQRVSRLRPPVPTDAESGVLCDSRQNQPGVPSTALAPHRQNDRVAFGPNDLVDRPAGFAEVSSFLDWFVTATLFGTRP